jgi:hypothetical protein
MELKDNLIWIIILAIAIFMVVNICWECSRPIREGFQDQSIQNQIDSINKDISDIKFNQLYFMGSPYSTASIALLIRYLIATDVLPKNFPTKPSDIITTLYSKANPNLKPQDIVNNLKPMDLSLQDSIYVGLSKVLDDEVIALKPKSRLGIF